MESLEFYAKVTLLAKQLGGAQELSCGDLEKLMELRRKFNVPGKHPGCKKCDKLGTSECRCKGNAEQRTEHTCTCGNHGHDDALVAEITKKVLAALGR